MSNRPTAEQMKAFTHVGIFCGICPVYVGNIESQAPNLCPRNWVPEWWMTMTEMLFGLFCSFQSFIDPTFVPMFPIKITGEL